MVKTDKKVYNVNLRKVRGFARNKKANNAISILRNYVSKHSKTDKIWLSQNVNQFIWVNGMKNVPSSVSIQVALKDNKAYVELANLDFKFPEDKGKIGGKTDKVEQEVKEKVEENVKDVAEKTKSVKPVKVLEDVEKQPVKKKSAKKEKNEKSKADKKEIQGVRSDLPENLQKILEKGSIDEAKKSIKKLNKKDLGRVLKFEEAHQNRKGVIQFLESNMR